MEKGQKVRADISARENGECIIDAVITSINNDTVSVRKADSEEEWDLKMRQLGKLKKHSEH